MEQLLHYFIIIPLVGCLLSVFPSNRKESLLFTIALLTIGIHLLGLLFFTGYWIYSGTPAIFLKGPVLYQTHHSAFSINFYFDKLTAVYSIIAAVITFLVAIFSRYYLHREKGYKRFFNNMLFFYLGLNIIMFSGNFETLFIGWEVIGITSFFLIAFYRDRYLPVKNALKVVSLYRLADIFLLLGIWLCHHYFEENITFIQLNNLGGSYIEIIRDPSFQLSVPFVFLIVALIKSAQFPFSSWLPRAMEGPTTSSAIFYGSLSVHMGVFLMIRSYPLWENNAMFKLVLISIGLFTSIMTASIARVQSSVKTQIAYSSIVQIGFMFIEVALGWHVFALFHFAGNAFLRTYQLLVSPAVLSYMVHDQFFNFVPPNNNIQNSFLGRLKLSLFMLSIKEFNLDTAMYNYLWKPLKKAGNNLRFIGSNVVLLCFIAFYAIGLYFVYHKDNVPHNILHYLPFIIAFIGFLFVLRAFTVRSSARLSWSLVIMNQLFLALAIAFNEQFSYEQVHIYLSGIFISGIIGYLCFYKLKKLNKEVDLDGFYGHSYKHPALSFIFLIACLGLAGFPITPTFIGEDLIIGHIHKNQFVLTALIALSFILDGLAIYRIYARVFLGPPVKSVNEVAYRSS